MNEPYPTICKEHHDYDTEYDQQSCHQISKRITLIPPSDLDKWKNTKVYPYKPLISGTICIDILLNSCGNISLIYNLNNAKLRSNKWWAILRIKKDIDDKKFIFLNL